jgi:hypothetical protein
MNDCLPTKTPPKKERAARWLPARPKEKPMNEQIFLAAVLSELHAADARPDSPILLSAIAARARESLPNKHRPPEDRCQRLAWLVTMLRYSPLDAFDPELRLVEILDPDLARSLAVITLAHANALRRRGRSRALSP